MSKQEKIKEGLAAELASFEGRDYWKMTDVDKEFWLTMAFGILKWEATQGVVLIDEDRELPQASFSGCCKLAQEYILKKMADYKPVMSLIEENNFIMDSLSKAC